MAIPRRPGWERMYEGSFVEAVLANQLNGDFPGPVLASVAVPFYSASAAIVQNRMPRACCSRVFTATRRIVGREAALQITSARVGRVVLLPFHERLHVRR